MGWHLVITANGQYWPEFDRDRVLEFCRVGSPEVDRYRLADVHPLFNVAGLLWRNPGTVEPWADFCERYGVIPAPPERLPTEE